MDALQELRIKAGMARELGHEDLAKGIEMAMATLGAAPQAELAMPRPAAPAAPLRSSARRRWLPTEASDLNHLWSVEGGELSVFELADRFKRTPVGIYHHAVHVLHLPIREKDRPVTQFKEQTR